ncbi:MAG: hypothetical protein KKI08_17290 [Armatimonadetes bacterium]|nr:hypothetical protein [Armatimonadota bacterium]
MDPAYEPLVEPPFPVPCWVAVLDIMGYAKLVCQAASDASNAGRTIGTLRDALGDVTSSWAAMRNDAASMSIISDSVCVSWPLEEKPSLNVANGVSAICLEFLKKGLFVRGSIAFGRHYNDGRLLFSPAFIEAHRAEGKEAFYPRVLCDYRSADPIILDDYARSLVVNYAEIDRITRRNYPDTVFDGIWQDWDGRFFINYLDGIDLSGGKPPGLFPPDLLGRHRDLIQDRLREFCDKPRIRAKYGWLASYHNRFCDSRGLSEYRIENAPSQGRFTT